MQPPVICLLPKSTELPLAQTRNDMARKKAKSKAASDIPLFFAFPDGVYDYVCAECTALCCRGQGFGGSLSREIGKLLSIYPALGAMAVSREGDFVSFATPAGRCHFLEPDNLCRIQKEHGKSLKPTVCRLFPFNSFTLVGDTVFITPHFMCPLRIAVPSRSGEVEGTHSLLEPAVRDSGILDKLSNPEEKSVPFHPSMTTASLMDRERRFRDACAEAIGRSRFADTLASESGDSVELRSVVRRAAAVMGFDDAPDRADRDAIDDLMHALASPLRVGLLQLSTEAILRALALSEMVVRKASSISGVPLSLQGAYSMITNLGHAIRVLARGDEPFELSSRFKPESPPFGDPDITFAAFSALRSVQTSGRILPSLEKSIAAQAPLVDRAVMLVQIGSKLEHGAASRSEKQKKEHAKRASKANPN